MPAVFLQALRYLVSVGLLLAGWHALVVLYQLPPYVLPEPAAVMTTLVDEWPWFQMHTLSTLSNVAAGALLGIGGGLIFGALIAYSRWARWVAEPYLVIFQSFPREALIPLFVVWLGFGAAPKILNAAMLSFFPMAVVTMNSLSDTRGDYLELVRNWGGNRLQQFLHCRIPAGIYSIAGGLKIAAPLAIIGAVIGEFLGANDGLGYVIVSSGVAFRLDRSFAAIMILATVGVLTLASIKFVQEVLLDRYKQE